MATAAQTIAALGDRRSSSTTSRPTSSRHAKLHVLDTLGCGLAAHATGVAGEGRATMAELGGEPQATVIGLDARGCRRPNAAFANAMLCHGLDFDDTHSDSVSHVSTVIAPGGARRGGGARRARSRTLLAAIVAGNEVVVPDRDGGVRRVPPRAASTRPRSAASSAASPRSARLTGLDAEATTRALGIAGSFAVGALRLPRRRHADEADPPRLGGARRATSRRGSPHHGAAGPPSVLEGKFGLYHAFLGAEQGEIDIDGAARRPRRRAGRRRGSRTSRTPSATSCTARSAPRPRPLPGARSTPDEIDDVLVTVPGGRRLARARAGGAEAARRAPSTRASSRLQYSIASHARARARRGLRLHRRGDHRPGACSPSPRKVRYETREYPTYPQAFPGGVVVRLADGTDARGRLPVPEGRPREPALARRGAREVPRERVARASRCRCGARSRRRSSRSRSRPT